MVFSFFDLVRGDTLSVQVIVFNQGFLASEMVIRGTSMFCCGSRLAVEWIDSVEWIMNQNLGPLVLEYSWVDWCWGYIRMLSRYILYGDTSTKQNQNPTTQANFHLDEQDKMHIQN